MDRGERDAITPPAGWLPAPSTRDLPEPVPLRQMVGPSVILAGLSIGSGEFVLWPRLTAEWGFAVFWAAWIGVTLQFFLNMEIARYSLATGESAVTGFLRLHRVWGPVFLVCATLPWVWPGWATGAATFVSWEIGGDVTWLAVGGLVGCGIVLSAGPVVYRTLETVQLVLVSVIFVLVLVLAVAVVSTTTVWELAHGASQIGHVPAGLDLPLFLGALAFAGAGGSVNLAQSNYIKDKGYGMGLFIGRITSPFTGRAEAAGDVGVVFPASDANLARWRVWWRRANLEHLLSFHLLCVSSLALMCLVARSLLPADAPVAAGMGFIGEQAVALETRFGAWARHLFLAAGVAVLLSTELALLDAVARVAADVVKVAFLRTRARWSLSRIYFAIVWSMIAFGITVLGLGFDQPFVLLLLSASLNALVMFLYAGLLLWLNLRTFSSALRPSMLRLGALLAAVGFFGYFSLLTVADRVARLG